MHKEQIATLAKNLRRHRKQKGLTQEHLSFKSGVAVRTIQRIENAKVEPQLQTLTLLAKSLELQVQELSEVRFTNSDQNEGRVQRKWLLIFHVSPIAGLLVPFANIVIPLLLWFFKRDDNSLYDEQGREVVNFHLTMTFVFMIGVGLLVLVFEMGLLLLMVSAVYTLVLILMNARRVTKNKECKYPLAIHFF